MGVRGVFCTEAIFAICDNFEISEISSEFVEKAYRIVFCNEYGTARFSGQLTSELFFKKETL